MKKQVTDHELDRIMVGNQIAMMRALKVLVAGIHPLLAQDLEIRSRDIKGWWREKYGEEVGFAAGIDQRPKSQ